MKNMEDNWEVFKELGINPVDIMRELAQIEEEADKVPARVRID